MVTVAHKHRAGCIQQSEMVIQGQENPAKTDGGQAESAPYLTRGQLSQSNGRKELVGMSAHLLLVKDSCTILQYFFFFL